MILLKLFLTFLKIGAVSFGGGYAMIPLMRDESLGNGWLTDEEFLNFVAVSESTPGPIAVNMATFIGSSQAGLLGSLCATIGVVLPSFIIILIISCLIRNLLKKSGVQAALGGVRPTVVGLIVGTGFVMLLSVIMNITTLTNVSADFSCDYKAFIIFAVAAITAIAYKKVKKKALSPIILILASAIIGMCLYSLPI